MENKNKHPNSLQNFLESAFSRLFCALVVVCPMIWAFKHSIGLGMVVLLWACAVNESWLILKDDHSQLPHREKVTSFLAIGIIAAIVFYCIYGIGWLTASMLWGEAKNIGLTFIWGALMCALSVFCYVVFIEIRTTTPKNT